MDNLTDQHENTDNTNNADSSGLITPNEKIETLNQFSARQLSAEPLSKVNDMDNNNIDLSNDAIDLEQYKAEHPQKNKTLLTDEQKLAWTDIYTEAVPPPIYIEEITNKAKAEQLLKRVAKLRKAKEKEELKKLTQQKANPQNLTPPFTFLGYDDGHHYFISNSALQIMCLSGEKLTGQAALMQLANLEWWLDNFGKYNAEGELTGPDWLRAGDWILTNSHSKGVYSSDTLRGRGFWYDNNKLVRHLGDRLIVDGQELPVNTDSLDHIYQLEGKVSNTDIEPATKDQTDAIYKLMDKMYWADEYSSALVIGWIITSAFAGILPWRSHMWITGPTGAGKSDTVLNAIKSLTAENSLMYVKGGVTEASIRQKMKLDAKACLIDEFEPNTSPDKSRIDKILGLARVASSDDDAMIMKGTSSGKVQEFRIRGMFAYASIKTRLIEDADKNRTAVVNLLKKQVSDSTRANFAEIKESISKLKSENIGNALIELVISRWDTFQQNLITCEKAINMLSASGREGKQYGVLLAGYYTMIQADPINEKAVTSWANNKGLAAMIAGELENNGNEWGELWREICSADLMLSNSSHKLTIGSAIEAIQDNDLDQLCEWGGWQGSDEAHEEAKEYNSSAGKKKIEKALKALGIVPRLKHGSKIQPSLAAFEGLEGVWIAVNSPKLKKLLSNTSFEDWQSHIKRAGTSPERPIKVNGKNERGYFVPFE